MMKNGIASSEMDSSPPGQALNQQHGGLVGTEQEIQERRQKQCEGDGGAQHEKKQQRCECYAYGHG